MEYMKGKPIRFLLVEDDEDHANLCMRSIRKSKVNCVVDHVSDGVEAMEFLRTEGRHPNAESPDVILLDLKLPRKGGLEVLQEIRAEKRLMNLLVVVLTTSAEERDRSSAYESRANSYLVKPVDSEKFQAMIQDLSRYWGEWNQPPPPR